MSVGDILLYSSLIPIRCLYPSFILYESSYLIRPHPGPHHWNQSAQARLLITRSASPSAPRRAPRNSFSTSGNFHRTSDWDIPKNMMTGCEHGDVENDRFMGNMMLNHQIQGELGVSNANCVSMRTTDASHLPNEKWTIPIHPAMWIPIRALWGIRLIM